jgi:hypothetical protein
MPRRMMVTVLAVILFPLFATADEQMIQIKSASDLKGTWSGPIGEGPFGSTRTGTMQVTIKEDGTFTSATRSATGSGAYRGTGQGKFELKADGTVAVAGVYSTGTWRLFDVDGRRVIRSETRNRTDGRPSWAEFTQEP